MHSLEVPDGIPAAELPSSVIKQTSNDARNIGAISLGQGIPSFAPPETAMTALREALLDPDVSKYPDYLGVPLLRDALADRLSLEVGQQSVTGKNILITIGAMGACSTGLLSVTNPGERIGVITPDYATHFPLIQTAHAKAVQIPMKNHGAWRLDLDRVEVEAKRGLKALLLTNPGNPTGAVIPLDQLAELVRLSNRMGFWILSDETYSYLTYTGNFDSLLKLSTQSERLLVARSFSKEYCMTGWRVGCLVMPEKVLRHFAKVNDALIGTAPRASQMMALGALQAPPEYVSDQVQEYARRGKFVMARLSEIPGFKVSPPEGAYYAFPRVGVVMPSETLKDRLLHEACVAVIPGSAFGEAGEGHIRISMGPPMPVLKEGLNRIAEFMNKNVPVYDTPQLRTS